MKALTAALGAAAVVLGGCASEARAPAAPTFVPVATVVELMESVIAHAAEKYWGAVEVVVDEAGVHEHFPATDEEWEEVWAAAMTIAEAGNLLMMAPRAVDEGAWMQFARSLVEAGVQATAAALTALTRSVIRSTAARA